ncbi:MAG TPA: LuxR C-terminal-related transcriptional regulator, partial [Propionibacteriaceae bacterium]|jgi:DNA-binding NarL/FixJ family response regulator|nr:LuxR C-terminal-related transcriptional regulator [Propionibacteriaceae bacterium]
VPLARLEPDQEPQAVAELAETYAEIARELVVSEETVSVHVSNLLRKTGTANRVELAGRARRTGLATRS